MHAALEQSAAQVVATARQLAPKDSGALAASISYTFGNYTPENANVRGFGAGKGDPDLSVTVHAGNAQAYYAAYVEFGTSPHDNKGRFKGTKNPGAIAQPFFYPAVRANKRAIKARIARAAKKSIKEEL